MNVLFCFARNIYSRDKLWTLHRFTTPNLALGGVIFLTDSSRLIWRVAALFLCPASRHLSVPVRSVWFQSGRRLRPPASKRPPFASCIRKQRLANAHLPHFTIKCFDKRGLRPRKQHAVFSKILSFPMLGCYSTANAFRIRWGLF